MKKTIIYLRQSLDTDKQPNSISTQKDMALEYVKRKDWIIHEIYNEGKRSARKTSIEERTVLSRLLSDVKKNKISRIIVFKRDRLARNVRQYIEIYRLLKKHNVEVHFTAENEPPPFEGVASEFIEAIMAGMSEYEGNNIVKRLIYSKIPLMNEGYWQVGGIPFAYESIKQNGALDKGKSSGGKLVPIPEKVKLVKALYESVCSIPHTIIETKDFNSVCKYIKQDKVFHQLSNEQIWKIIVQPLHKGVMIQSLDREEYRADNEVTQALRVLENDDIWEKANEIFTKLRVPDYISKQLPQDEKIVIDPSPLLEGVLFCGICKKPLLPKKKVYKCENKECGNSPKMKDVEEKVLAKLYDHLLEKGNQEWGKVIQHLNVKYATPFKQLSDKKKTLSIELEQRIKKEFARYLSENTHENEIILSSLVEQYKKVSKEIEVLDSLYFHIYSFLATLDKEEILERVSLSSLTRIQKLHLLSLVNQVFFYKEPVKLSYYVYKESVHE